MSEVWRSIPGYEGRYEVSDIGSVRNSAGRLIVSKVSGKYLSVGIYKHRTQRRNHSVHVLVLLAFKGPRPPGLVGAHLDGDRSNNAAGNLAWVTPAENESHKRAHRELRGGTLSTTGKFSDAQVQIIREAYALGLSAEKIATLTDVWPASVHKILGEHATPSGVTPSPTDHPAPEETKGEGR